MTIGNPLESLCVEINYRLSLRLLSEPKRNRERLAEKLRTYGCDVGPDDFLGAKLMTDPEDRKYLRSRYGVTFYPSTLYIPDGIWFPAKYGGIGLVERLARGKLADTQKEYPTGWSLYLRKKPLALIKLSVATSFGKNFHEDFHERFYLTRGHNLTPEEEVLGELHSAHSNIDEGIAWPESLKEYLCTDFPQFSSQIASVMDSLPHLEETLGDRKLEQLLLKAPSLDYILEQTKVNRMK